MTIKILVRKVSRIIPFLTKCYFVNWNRIKFRINGIRYGKNLSVYNKIYLSVGNNAQMMIGDNFKFTSGAGINPLCRNVRGQIYMGPNAEIKIGNNTGISSACLWSKNRITIGNNVNIGGNCVIMDTDAHSLDWRIRAGLVFDERGNLVDEILSASSIPIVIEDNAFIGTQSIILKGVTIGARSIIAAGSVVTKSIPADCIAGGNPCKIIRKLNEQA